MTGWAVRSCWSPGNCLLKFCALLPPLEDDPPDPAAPIDEPDDAVDAPAIAEDAGTPGDVVAMELPDETGGATGIMPAASLAIPAKGLWSQLSLDRLPPAYSMDDPDPLAEEIRIEARQPTVSESISEVSMRPSNDRILSPA